MKQFFTYRLACIITLAIIKPVAGFALEKGGGEKNALPDIHVMPAVADTVPSPAKTGEAQEEKLPDIKKVPKSRRQVKPLPIPAPIPVKPIKVIKPKVIKPKVRITL